MATMGDRASAALSDILAAVGGVAAEAHASALNEIVGARRIACAGVGREGLMMRALAMRLFHLGLDAHVVGDMTTPPLGPGDLLIVSAGPGEFATMQALSEVAARAGARRLVLTAEADGAVPAHGDRVVLLPAQTMASDTSAAPSILLMGSVYEGALFLWSELLVLDLAERLGVGASEMRARHTNLE